jgi:gluconolactonase
MNRAVLAAAVVVIACAAMAQEFSEMRVELLTNKLGYTEGPAWSKDGYLIFSDTPADKLMKWTPGREVEVFRASANGPSGNAFDAEGRLYTCETHTRRLTRTLKNGTVEVVADKFEGKRFNAPNDIVISKAGHIYFTDPAFGEQGDHRELDFYGVYHLAPKSNAAQLVAKPVGRPNGIALSPNGRLLYVANSDERNLRVYDLDRNGVASNERVLISKIQGVPGGVRTDETGRIFIVADGLLIYAADGKLLHHFELHLRASNLGFGETDLMSLFVTGTGAVYRTRLEVRGAY